MFHWPKRGQNDFLSEVQDDLLSEFILRWPKNKLLTSFLRKSPTLVKSSMSLSVTTESWHFSRDSFITLTILFRMSLFRIQSIQKVYKILWSNDTRLLFNCRPQTLLWVLAFIFFMLVAPRWNGYHYCTTSFNKVWTQILRRFKPCSRRVGDLRWWESLTIVPAGNKAKMSFVGQSFRKNNSSSSLSSSSGRVTYDFCNNHAPYCLHFLVSC